MKRRTRNRFVQALLFVCYILLMMWLLFGQRTHKEVSAENLNLKPFATLKLYVRILKNNTNGYLLRHAFINLFGNIVMFIPLGFFLPCIIRRTEKLLSMILYTVLVIVLIETFQYITGLGSCDVDDLILNVPGAVIGWCIRWITSERYK